MRNVDTLRSSHRPAERKMGVKVFELHLTGHVALVLCSGLSCGELGDFGVASTGHVLVSFLLYQISISTASSRAPVFCLLSLQKAPEVAYLLRSVSSASCKSRTVG